MSSDRNTNHKAVMSKAFTIKLPIILLIGQTTQDMPCFEDNVPRKMSKVNGIRFKRRLPFRPGLFLFFLINLFLDTAVTLLPIAFVSTGKGFFSSCHNAYGEVEDSR